MTGMVVEEDSGEVILRDNVIERCKAFTEDKEEYDELGDMGFSLLVLLGISSGFERQPTLISRALRFFRDMFTAIIES